MKTTATVLMAILMLSACERWNEPGPRTRDKAEAYDPLVYRDQLTGCEYLTRGQPASSLTPRMGRDGKQICTDKP